ncbi:cupin domain-containing protein [Clostridium polyendosporum]|nr:cupin domain-containing protein [Clostridium polyendosporum]
MYNFITPPNHFGFKAKKITEEIKGKISDCSIAYIESQGGGPEPSHTHVHDHFFVVIEGIATIKMGEKKITVNVDESIIVPGLIIHSIWNETDKPLKMIGITIQPEK